MAIRRLAGTPDRYETVLDYGVRDGLLAYEQILRDEARMDYHTSTLVWAALAATGATKQKKPPAAPPILKD